MKVSIVQPYYSNIWEAIGLGYIAAYCKKKYGSGVYFNFFQSYFDTDQKIIAESINSDIVAFSCTSPTFKHGLDLARKIKAVRPSIRIVFGGHHVSALHEYLEEDCIDQIVVGEGEIAFLEILHGNSKRIIKGKRIGFNKLPWPDRNLIKNIRTVKLCKKLIGKRIASFQANRNCLFQCKFCAESIITGKYNKIKNPIRTRNIQDLLDEIQFYAKKYRLDRYKFVDATFNTSTEFILSFCEEKIKRGFSLEWECMMHAGLAKKEIFPWLKRAGCVQINVGCESGSPRVLKEIGKGVSVENIKNVFKWAKNNGIKRRAFFLIGMPCEEEGDIQSTKKLMKSIEADVLGVTILCPYPGSIIYDHNSMKNIPWEDTDEYSNDFWQTSYFLNSKLHALQEDLIKNFHNCLTIRQAVNQIS